MITNKLGALEYLTAENIPVSHCFTTRLGGVSTEPHLASMNIGTHRGDRWENVLENYRILGSALGFDPHNLVLTHQTHTDLVVAVDDSFRGAGLYAPELSDCDGLVTNTPGVGLVVFSADCTPILYHDPVTGAVGAVHAGWRGTAAGIAAKAVEAMVSHYGCDPKNIHAAIGPNIRQCCFETNWDVPQAMLDALGEEANAHILPKGDKYYVNLTEINRIFLRRAGVENITASTECTKCNPHRYWSARITGNHRGSQGALILR
ncbi:MAG: peptidoglycan editing factor PgeF [Ruminococcaceae bacterium]|nr:peptidoglycan editing factor PgeF [Oscillospiraceae bacterium]